PWGRKWGMATPLRTESVQPAARGFEGCREEDEIVFREEEIELWEDLRRGLFLLLFFGGGDEVAEPAGMFAIERLQQRLAHRRALGKTPRHAYPGHRLQKGPVHAQGDADESHEGQLRNSAKHSVLVAFALASCQRRRGS